MKTNIFLALPIAFCFMSLTACTQGITGEGESVVEKRELPAFTQVDLALAAKVTVRQGATYKVEITAQPNILKLLDTKVSGNELTIGCDKNLRNHKEIRITVTLPKLEGFEVSGSGDVNSPDVFESDKVEVEINGSGSFAGNFVAGQIKSEISGSGSVRLKGSANELKHETNGSGALEAGDLRSKSVSIQVNGSGDCKVWADEELRSEINGSGSVIYKGAPAKMNQEVNGSGTVRKI